MMEDAERRHIAMLIVKKIRGDISEPEEKELAQWAVGHPTNDLLLDQYTDEWLVKNALLPEGIGRKDIDLAGMQTWELIARQAPELSIDDEKAGKGKVRFLGGAWSRLRQYQIPGHVAMWVVICKTAFIFFLWKSCHVPGEKKGTIESSAMAVIEAAYQANVSLPDGRVVNTAMMPVGEIAQWANLSLWKEKNGLLAYHSKGDNHGKTQWASVSTPPGGWYNVILPDGSRVKLNAASSLSVSTAYGQEDRNVKLDGEAYFEVMRLPQPHFTVMVKDMMKVTALGTGFNVMAYADDPFVKTTLLHGAVQVADIHNAFSQLLRPGEQYLHYTHGRDTLLRKVDTGTTTAWTNGDFVFKGEPLMNIMRQIGRWYAVQVHYRDTPSINLTMQGRHQDDLAVLLNRLEATQQVHFTVYNRNRVIVSRLPP